MVNVKKVIIFIVLWVSIINNTRIEARRCIRHNCRKWDRVLIKKPRHTTVLNPPAVISFISIVDPCEKRPIYRQKRSYQYADLLVQLLDKKCINLERLQRSITLATKSQLQTGFLYDNANQARGGNRQFICTPSYCYEQQSDGTSRYYTCRHLHCYPIEAASTNYRHYRHKTAPKKVSKKA